MSSDYRRPWTSEEDSAIRLLVEELGIKNWSLVASELAQRYSIKHRSGKQCRERWHNHLDASIDKKPWTQEEDDLIFDLHKEFGKSWSKIAERIPGRTDNSVKNRFYSTLRRNLRKYNKSRPHSERLVGSVRTILRNPDIPEILLKEQAPPRLKKGKNNGMEKEEVNVDEGLECCIEKKIENFEENLEVEKKGLGNREIVVPVPSKGDCEKKCSGFERIASGMEEANLLFSLSQPELNYFMFYPQALAAYKGNAKFPPFICNVFAHGFPMMMQSNPNLQNDKHK
jgi:myb proto-oncogene protein